MVTCWQTLGIGATADISLIRKAYARLAKQHRPEDDVLAFHTLRQAYEQAMEMAQWQAMENAHDQEEALADTSAVDIESAKSAQVYEVNQAESGSNQSTVSPAHEVDDPSALNKGDTGAGSVVDALKMEPIRLERPAGASSNKPAYESSYTDQQSLLIMRKLHETQIEQLSDALCQAIRAQAGEAPVMAALDALLAHEGMHNIQIADQVRHQLVWITVHEEFTPLAIRKAVFERFDLKDQVNLANGDRSADILGNLIFKAERWQLFQDCAAHRSNSAESYLLTGLPRWKILQQETKDRMVQWLDWFEKEDAVKLHLLNTATVQRVNKKLRTKRFSWITILGVVVFFSGFLTKAIALLMGLVVSSKVEIEHIFLPVACIFGVALYFLPEIGRFIGKVYVRFASNKFFSWSKTQLRSYVSWCIKNLKKPLVRVELGLMLVTCLALPWLDSGIPWLQHAAIVLGRYEIWLVIAYLVVWLFRGRIKLPSFSQESDLVISLFAFIVTLGVYVAASAQFTFRSTILSIPFVMVFIDRAFPNPVIEDSNQSSLLSLKHHQIAIPIQKFTYVLAIITAMFVVLTGSLIKTQSVDLTSKPAPWIISALVILIWAWSTQLAPRASSVYKHCGISLVWAFTGIFLSHQIAVRTHWHEFWVMVSVGLFGLVVYWALARAIRWRRSQPSS
jgi:hypothetical protein